MNKVRNRASGNAVNDDTMGSISDQFDLMGKTIAGIVAAPTRGEGPLKIWMLRFTDGTHVEFVSPGSRRTLERLAKQARQQGRRNAAPGRDSSASKGVDSALSQAVSHPQLALNVA